MEETESSEEEDETFSYYLTKGEVEKIWDQQYVDYGAIHRRNLTGLYATQELGFHRHGPLPGLPAS